MQNLQPYFVYARRYPEMKFSYSKDYDLSGFKESSEKNEMSEYQDFTVQKASKDFGIFRRHIIENVPIWLKVLPLNSEVFFDECAHMGGQLSHSNGFTCKSHGWTYSETGNNLNPKSPGLRRVEVVYENENSIVLRLRKKTPFETDVLDSELKISVLSHACLQLEHGSKKILFDPWLSGTAFYGSWFLEPNLEIQPSQLKVDAIIITHPHPDHFHLETLDLMDKSTPIYFPGFPSKIIEKGLRSIGWKNLYQVPWDFEFEVCDSIFLRFLQPRSLWEDSATLLRVVKETTIFTWLNLVDAGSVIDEYLIPSLDLLSSAFDQGASGYPLTWTQISEKNQVKILEAQKSQKLLNLPAKASQLRARHFLPFAGHWRLRLSEHMKYAESIPHTTFGQLEESFKTLAPDTKFLGLLPGATYDFNSNTTTIFETEKAIRKTEESEQLVIAKVEVTSRDRKAFANFMSELTDASTIYDSEHVEFCVQVEQTSIKEIFLFGQETEEKIKISVTIPVRIYLLLANRVANWDHVAIGYWGKWVRTPNKYPANFMRLLQVGKPDGYECQFQLDEEFTDELLRKTIAELMEKNPKEFIQLLTRVGLPCGACSLTNSETLAQALAIHRVDLGSKPWFIRELAAIWMCKAAD